MEKIAEYRNLRGLTQEQLAERIGVLQCSVQKMEQPGKFPAAGRLPDIADVLGCSIDALFGREEP